MLVASYLYLKRVLSIILSIDLDNLNYNLKIQHIAGSIARMRVEQANYFYTKVYAQNFYYLSVKI